MLKTFVRFFTIADYEEEEIWLRKQHRSGWKLVDMTPPCFFAFESCEPEDVVYRLDFKNNEESDDYMQMLADFGWEYCARCFGWLYFRKPAEAAGAEGEDELFSDNASRVEMVSRIVRRRMVPLAIIFLCCVIPNLFNALEGVISSYFVVLFGVLFVIYVYLIAHCGFKLKRLRDRYGS